MKTPLLIEQHLHGAFGVDFNKATVSDVLFVAQKLLQRGVGGFFPTLVTDSVENIRRQIEVIKQATNQIGSDCAEILGIHLEGIFINPEKKGIHNPEHFMALTVENYQKIEDEFIKIITLAPELDEGLIEYLSGLDIKIQAGHCVGADLSRCDGVTHLFNAMQGISHRGRSTVLSALINDDIYTEIIADGVHLNEDTLRLVLKTKQFNRILLISDALPITYSDMKTAVFADEEIFYDGERATSKDGTIAGSTTLLDKVVKFLGERYLFSVQYVKNLYDYHGISIDGELEWDDDYNIKKIRKGSFECVAMQ